MQKRESSSHFSGPTLPLYQVLSYAHKNVFFPEGSGFNPDVRNGDRLGGKVARVASIIFPQPLVIEKLNKLSEAALDERTRHT